MLYFIFVSFRDEMKKKIDNNNFPDIFFGSVNCTDLVYLL